VWGVFPGGRAHRAAVDLEPEEGEVGGREKWAAGTQRVAVVGELGQQAARGGQHLKRVGVVLGDVDLDLGQVDLDLGQVAEIADNRGDSMG
jgi:hypothetical protein